MQHYDTIPNSTSNKEPSITGCTPNAVRTWCPHLASACQGGTSGLRVSRGDVHGPTIGEWLVRMQGGKSSIHVCASATMPSPALPYHGLPSSSYPNLAQPDAKLPARKPYSKTGWKPKTGKPKHLSARRPYSKTGWKPKTGKPKHSMPTCCRTMCNTTTILEDVTEGHGSGTIYAQECHHTLSVILFQ